MTIATKIFTLLRGNLIGNDEFGNRYYEDKKTDSNSGRKKRWVMYNGIAEPSKVPPQWHAWLHYTVDEVLKDRKPWQQDYTPNLTGTKNAYFPAGDKRSAGERKHATGDYQSWNPES